MKKIKTVWILLIVILFTFSCKNKKDTFDATGSFETEEIIVSAEQTGKILSFNIEEGQLLSADTIIGQIDVSSLNIQKEQTEAAINAIGNKVNNASPQVSIFKSQIVAQQSQIQTINQQISVVDKEVKRTQLLVDAEAMPGKQLDDLVGQKSILLKQLAVAKEQIGVLNTQINSAIANVSIQNKGILSEVNPTKKKIDIINDQINRGQIKNIFPGTILTKYAMAGEFTNVGKPLYKIADLSTMILRVYVSGNQLPLIKLNQKVKVHTDDGKGGFKETEGIITWISSNAEFTPKTIQTRDERANMVYAIKVLVKNDGTYKIGMYGEIKFQ